MVITLSLIPRLTPVPSFSDEKVKTYRRYSPDFGLQQLYHYQHIFDLIWTDIIIFFIFFCRRSLVIIMHYFHWSLLVSVLVSQTHNQAWTLCMISKCSQGWKTHFERWDNIFAQQIKYWSHEQYSRLLALKFQLEDHSVRYMFTSRYKFWTRNIVVNKFVCGQHLRYFCQIVTDLGFVFTTVVLHSETVGGTKFHKMPISTSCYINMRYKIN